MTYRAIPVAIVEGHPTVPIDYLIAVYLLMDAQGKTAQAFSDGRVHDVRSWLDHLFGGQNHTVLVVDDEGECVFFAWINGLEDGVCQGHFCVLADQYDRRMHRAVLDFWARLRDVETDEPLIEVMLGIHPEHNEGAARLARIMGFSVLGTIPGLCRMADGSRVGGTITYEHLQGGRYGQIQGGRGQPRPEQI